MKQRLLLFALLLLIGCAPDGVEVDGDSASIVVIGCAYFDASGVAQFESSQLKPEVAGWLGDEGYAYNHFELIESSALTEQEIKCTVGEHEGVTMPASLIFEK